MENQRSQSQMMRIGTVASVDAAAATCRVSTGEITTGDIPWLVSGAGSFSVWSCPRVGEQVLLLCPEGDIEGAIVLRGIYSTAYPAPRQRIDTTLIRFPDGAELEYDEAAHALTATLPSGGTAALSADGGITFNGPVTINGTCDISDTLSVDADIDSSATVTGSTDVIGGGKSLKGHKHGGVQTGSGQTGAPA